jgi:hypothetical protein
MQLDSKQKNSWQSSDRITLLLVSYLSLQSTKLKISQSRKLAIAISQIA